MIEVGVAQILAAISVEASHCFRQIVDGFERVGAVGVVGGASEHAHHLQNAHATRAGRWRSDDVIAAISPARG